MFPLKMDKSFTAELMYLDKSGEPDPVLLISRAFNYWTDVTPAGTGWLCLLENARDYKTTQLRLRFEFIEQEGDNLYFRVSCALDYKGYLGTHLDTSRNGYLGLYGALAPDVYWTFEKVNVLTGYDDLRPAFTLRNNRGERVGYKWDDGVRYLNSSADAKPLTFTLDHYQAL